MHFTVIFFVCTRDKNNKNTSVKMWETKLSKEDSVVFKIYSYFFFCLLYHTFHSITAPGERHPVELMAKSKLVMKRTNKFVSRWFHDRKVTLEGKIHLYRLLLKCTIQKFKVVGLSQFLGLHWSPQFEIKTKIFSIYIVWVIQGQNGLIFLWAFFFLFFSSYYFFIWWIPSPWTKNWHFV